MRKKVKMFNLATLKPALTRSFGRASLQVQKFSPEILTTVGIAGVVTAGVLASRATLKLSPILEEKNENLEKVKQVRSRPDADEVYPESAANQDIAKIYIRSGLDIIKLYGPALTLGALSIVSIVSAQGILRKRNVALAAAYKTIESAFSEYRERVREELGDEQELDIYRNVEEEEVKNEETGKKEIVKNQFPGHSPYAKLFDEMSGQWVKNADYNLMFLRTQEQIFNDRLNAKGHVFLNEVYDALDIPRTQAGQVVGWLRGGDGDDYVDFGIYDVKDPAKAAFVNGYERAILLDFNVDGPIMEMI